MIQMSRKSVLHEVLSYFLQSVKDFKGFRKLSFIVWETFRGVAAFQSVRPVWIDIVLVVHVYARCANFQLSILIHEIAKHPFIRLAPVTKLRPIGHRYCGHFDYGLKFIPCGYGLLYKCTDNGFQLRFGVH